MSLLPMRKCKRCKSVYTMPNVGIINKCPKCGSLRTTKSTPLDIISNKKIDISNRI